MSLIQTVFWWEVDKKHSGLKTNEQHEIHVQREAIPLIFVPGIMGTRLRRSGTDGTGKGPDGLPNMRWDPNDVTFMKSNFLFASPTERKAMLVGNTFDPDYLEPANSHPLGDGFTAIMDDYCNKFLKPLKHHDWGALGKVFEFPVFAFGYNWSDSAENAGKKLASRIKEIIAEAKRVIGYCEKVILISHSMGGLVCRWASEVAGASASILGIVHAVQPVNGTPAAYWRMKAGFEASFYFSLSKTVASFGSSYSIGASAREVTPLLGNMPGALELLPNKLHRTNDGSSEWLKVKDNSGEIVLALPKSDPYSEIYRVKAEIVPGPTPGGHNYQWAKPTVTPNKYWGLVDPSLLDPTVKGRGSFRDQMREDKLLGVSWYRFLGALDIAERFHESLANKAHSSTFNAHGVGFDTADVVEMNWLVSALVEAPSSERAFPDSYLTRGFVGFFNYAFGYSDTSMCAILQDPKGDGDGTVARSSGAALERPGKQVPGDIAVRVEHQPAYEHPDIQAFAFKAITALCREHYEAKRQSLGNFPAPAVARK